MPAKNLRRLVLELEPKQKDFLAAEAKAHGTSMAFIVRRQIAAWQGAVERARDNNPRKARSTSVAAKRKASRKAPAKRKRRQ